MRPASLVSLALASTALVAVVVGCNAGTDASFGYDGVEGASPGATPASAPGCATATPKEKLADPSSLSACAPACGGAHCVPGDKVPEGSRASFASCSGGYCLPDTLIQSGGAKPPTCASLNGAPGVCLSTCVPQVAQNQDILPQASCGADERCAPCVNPNDGTVTGACAIGEEPASACADGGAPDSATPAPDLSCPHEGSPVLDPATLPACGPAGSAAHCLPAHLTPADLTSKLAACTGGFCVPDKLIASGGRFVPPTCTSLGGAEGRCTSAVLPSVASQTMLPVSTCDASERCVPCSNPVDGVDTGACKTSCDPGPTTAPVAFAGCCGKGGVAVGKCVPRASIPASMQSVLEDHGCQSQSLCVPTENLTAGYTPPACIGDPTFASKYTGVCLSDCLDFGFASSLVLDRGNCPKDHTCAPCKQDGKNTGAPGCPP